MSRMLTAKDNQPTAMNRRNPETGELFQVVPRQEEYAVPPAGTYGRFKITGISDTFEMTSERYGTSTKVRVEILIEKVQDPESKYLEGKRFAPLFGWSVGPKSHLGKLFGKLRGTPIQPGEQIDPDDYIDTSFVTATTLDVSGDGAKSYPGVSADSIVASKTVLSKWLTEPKQPALVAAGGGGDDLEDPFPHDDDNL